ncbi:ubiquinol-cytochrome c reductase iron-sulfur subunit [Thermodesulfobacteriota bacterium]
MEKAAKKRRKFIKTLALVVVSLPLLGKYLIPRLKQQKLLLRVKKKDIPGGGALVFRKKQIAVIKKGRDVYALGMACTHLGCTLNASPEGFACPCHGSVFNNRGAVLRGPADRPLPRYTVKERGDHIIIMSS